MARRDFWLYVDEFQNFITPSMAEILSGARKYRLGLILAHQELRQLERDREVQSAVLSNCFTRVVFRVGTEDARKLSEGLSTFDTRDLQNLDSGQAICRVERSDFDFNLTIPNPAPGEHSDDDSWARSVASASRDRYATPRAQIEGMLRAAADEQPAPAKEPAPPPPPPPAEPPPSKPTPPPPLPPSVPSGVPKPQPKAKAEQTEVPVAESQVAPKAAEAIETLPPVAADTASETVEQADEQAHLAIKERIGKHAETLDYTVTYEEHVLDGKGRVDVVLRRGTRAVACEVCASNNVKYEVNNVLKCLQAGFREVVVVCPNRSKLARIQKAVANALTPEQKDRVNYRLPEGFMTSLLDWAAGDPEGAVAESGKPRKQKITLGSSNLNDSERSQREKDMLEQMATAMRRNKAG